MSNLPPGATLQKTAPPAGAYIADRVNFDIIRRSDQRSVPRPVQPDRVKFHQAKRTYPTESKLHVPETRNLDVEVLSEERCVEVARRQKWVLAWYFGPLNVGIPFDALHIVILGFYKNKRKADKQRVIIMRQHPTRLLLTFQTGYWLAFPMPRNVEGLGPPAQWESAAIAYNLKVIQQNMSYDKKTASVELELLKRRSKRDPNEPGASAQDATKIVEDTIYGVTDAEVQSDQYYGTAADDNMSEDEGEEKDYPAPRGKVENISFAVHPDEIDPGQSSHAVMQDAKAYRVRSQKYGLAWGLPTLQRSRPVDGIAAAFLGAFSSPNEVSAARVTIQKRHPEWHIYEYELGTPLPFPVPQWKLQRDGNVRYDQETVTDFMHRGDDDFAQHLSNQQQEQARQRLAEQNTNNKDDMADEEIETMLTKIAGPPVASETDGPISSMVDSQKDLVSLNRQQLTTKFGTATIESFGPASSDTTQMAD